MPSEKPEEVIHPTIAGKCRYFRKNARTLKAHEKSSLWCSVIELDLTLFFRERVEIERNVKLGL